MLDLLTGFVAELRAAGIPVSLTEHLDAAEALRHVPMEDREAIKYTLGASLVKSSSHWRAYETLNGEEKWEKAIDELMEAVDTYIPMPERIIDKPFLMPVEDIFSIQGRGTVVTGGIEKGICKVGEEMEIVGFTDTRKTVVTGVEMFKKLLDEGRAGDNVGCCCAALKKTMWSAGR